MTHEILVAEVEALASIGALRSLGHAGYRPHAVSADAGALGLKSKYAFNCSVHPAYDSSDFLPWLCSYVADHPIRGMICSEGLLHAISNNYEEFRHLIPDSTTAAINKLCLSKAAVWRRLLESPRTSRSLPDSGVCESSEAVESAVESLPEGATAYLKTDRQHAQGALLTPKVLRVAGSYQFRTSASEILKDYSALLWQRHVSGVQVGVSLWRHNGKILAENMVRGLHTYPHYAGSMSLRTTWWHDGILADAEAKLTALEWNGVAMMEYIWDPNKDVFWFIEMNPRFWAYLHLDLSSGKDFPRWLMDGHFGKLTTSLGPPPGSAITMRYVAPGEIIHLASRWLDRDISWGAKLKSLWRFVRLSLDPRIKADLWFPGDKLLYVRGWLSFLLKLPEMASRVFGRSR